MLRRVFFLLLLLSCSSVCVYAEDQVCATGWNPSSAGPVTSWTAPLCGKGKFVIQPFFFYNYSRGFFNSDGHYDSLTNGDKKYK